MWLRWMTVDGQLISPATDEATEIYVEQEKAIIKQQVEVAEQRAEVAEQEKATAQQRAEAAEQEIERLRALLQERGTNPEI